MATQESDPAHAESAAARIAASHSVGFQIDDLSVDLGRALVQRGDLEFPLPKLSFELLVALARAAPNLLTLDELMEQVWPGLVVAPDTVSQRVKLLRAALGDDSKTPRYIVGVRGRGYRLIASVRELPGSVPQEIRPSQSDVLPAATVEPRARWQMAVVIGGLLMTIAVTAVMLSQRATKSTSPATSAAIVAMLPERSIAVLPFVNLGHADDSDLLALGIPEAVLHQLATLRNLQVIARTSSFAYRDSKIDARVIGHDLNARYLLEGSVQAERSRLRITAQLVDAASGDHVWSMQFDKTPDDIFAVQDEIALRVARALQVSLDAGAGEQLAARNTANFDAYLEYLQAGTLLATWRLADMQAAIARAAKAVELDPAFAAAYVLLTKARVRYAEYNVVADRRQRLDAAVQEGLQLLQRALQLDGHDSRVYVERAYLTAFHDVVAAEKDYRTALELNPNDAEAYEGLAVILADQPEHRADAVIAINRARKLDPLEPRLDVIKATMIYYGRGDVDGAVDLVMAALNRNPLYVPALARLEQLRLEAGRHAEAINLGQQAFAIDPHADQAREILAHAYLDLDELAAAQAVATGNGDENTNAQIAIRVYQHDFQRAATLAYAAAASNTLSGASEVIATGAIRIDARSSGQYARAAAFFTQRGGIKWDASGRLLQGDVTSIQLNAVSLADMLLQMGERGRASELLEASLAAMDRDVQEYQRGEHWYFIMRPIALALLGRNDAALTVLQSAARSGRGGGDMWYRLELEPTFASLRSDPRFVAMRAQQQAHAQAERKALQRLRSQGLVPAR